MNTIIGAMLSPLLFLPGLILKILPFKSVVSKKQKRILTVLYIFALLVHAEIYHLAGADAGLLSVSFLKIDMIIFGFATSLINIAVVRGRIREHLFAYGLTMLLNYINLTLTLFLTNVLIHAGVKLGQFTLYISFYVVLNLIIFPLSLKLLNITLTPFLGLESGNYWNAVWFVPIAMFLSCYFTAFGEELLDSLPQIIGRLFLFASTLCVCLGVKNSYLRTIEQLESKKQLEMQKVYYSELSDQVTQARQARHDMKHHMAAIQQFIDSDDKEGLQSYCYDFSKSQTGEVIPYTGSAAADGVLYHYGKIAKENGIDFELKGSIKSNGISDVDLCVLLGNALDNAITGCLTVEENRSICVISDSDDFTLSVLIANSFDGKTQEENGEIMSRKAENRKGVGINSMKKTCEKYGGSADISFDDSTFKIMFVLPTQNKA